MSNFRLQVHPLLILAGVLVVIVVVLVVVVHVVFDLRNLPLRFG